MSAADCRARTAPTLPSAIPASMQVLSTRCGASGESGVPPYREWDGQGPRAWVVWAVIGGLAAVIVGLLFTR